jgi:2',3'-cyclic-nucleotide 2'-phosphodiesterase (5'-nucleotidase family)
MMKYIPVVLFSCILAAACIGSISGCRPAISEGPAQLTILHTNDTHAHLDNVAARCALTTRLRSENTQSDELLLDAGDVFAGTPYFSLFKGQADLWYMKYLKYDAMCPGNHEFDKGNDVLEEFVKNTGFPVLCANFDFSKAGALGNQVQPWVIIERGGHKYGVFGLTTEETAEISRPGPEIVINDHLTWAKRAVEYFQGKGVNKIIALTHIGWDEDARLANEVEGIDIIVGGHSHTVPDVYPLVVNKFSAPTVIVQAGCYNRYLGRLNVDFDGNGVITGKASGELIAIDNTLPADKTAADRLAEYQAPISVLMNKAAGSTQVALDGEGEHVRTMETNLGNLVADASLDKGRYINAVIALVNGGGIRSSLPAGEISIGQVYEVLPFDNYLVSADISGKQLIGALENGVSKVEGVQGRFLQVAGMRFKWDGSALPGKRIVSADVNTLDGYKPVEADKTYRVVTSDYVAGGGDGFTDIKAAANQVNLAFPLTDVVAEYLEQHSPVNPQVEGRIIRIDGQH